MDLGSPLGAFLRDTDRKFLFGHNYIRHGRRPSDFSQNASQFVISQG